MANKKRLGDLDHLKKLMLLALELSGEECFTKDDLIYSFDNAPLVDAVEVVRCGECWAYNQPDCPMNGSPGKVSVSDFCSYGERRTDG